MQAQKQPRPGSARSRRISTEPMKSPGQSSPGTHGVRVLRCGDRRQRMPCESRRVAGREQPRPQDQRRSAIVREGRLDEFDGAPRVAARAPRSRRCRPATCRGCHRTVWPGAGEHPAADGHDHAPPGAREAPWPARCAALDVPRASPVAGGLDSRSVRHTGQFIGPRAPASAWQTVENLPPPGREDPGDSRTVSVPGRSGRCP